MNTTAELTIDAVRSFPFLAKHPQYDSPAKRDNLQRLEAARSAGLLLVEADPAYIRLEASAHCNLHCCWAQREPQHPRLRPRGHATPELAQQIVAQIGHHLYKAVLCHWGEPMLNPQLPEIVSVFHNAGIYTTFDTNMILMTEAKADLLIEAGLDAVSASIDGVSQAAYGRYRVGGSVDRAMAGLRCLLERRRHCGTAHPSVRWQFLVFEHNAHEVEQAARLAADFGVDRFDVRGGSGQRWTPAQGLLPVQKPERPAGLLCSDPWTYLAVDWDGAVHLCCRAFQARHVMGHMEQQTLGPTFDNHRFQMARRVIGAGLWNQQDPPIPCTGCSRVTAHVPEIRQLGHGLGLGDP